MLWINALVRASKPPQKLMTLVPIKSDERPILKMPLTPTVQKVDPRKQDLKTLENGNLPLHVSNTPSYKMPAAKFTPSIFHQNEL
jgi:hypothetical protein